MASLFSIFLLCCFHSFSNKQHRAGENMIIKGQKKNSIKEESKKKSKERKNVQKNHPCFSLMQPHTIFNMKKPCNVFLRHILLTCCQFQHLKYYIYLSISIYISFCKRQYVETQKNVVFIYFTSFIIKWNIMKYKEK